MNKKLILRILQTALALMWQGGDLEELGRDLAKNQLDFLRENGDTIDANREDYGVNGMKWGVRHAPDKGSMSGQPQKQSKDEYQHNLNKYRQAQSKGSVSENINKRQQEKHKASSNLYESDKSTVDLTDQEIQRILNTHDGSGAIWEMPDGSFQEIFVNDKPIGTCKPKRGKPFKSVYGAKRYGKSGGHIYPIEPFE